jgi:hypothetical protein
VHLQRQGAAQQGLANQQQGEATAIQIVILTYKLKTCPSTSKHNNTLAFVNLLTWQQL